MTSYKNGRPVGYIGRIGSPFPPSQSQKVLLCPPAPTIPPWLRPFISCSADFQAMPGYAETSVLTRATRRNNPEDTILHNVSTTESSKLMLCKIWGFHGGDYEVFHLLGYKTPVPTSQETHYVTVTEPSRLMLCKIWGFQGGDYEECRPLGYKNPVRTSQETHYVSTTDSSQLMICKFCSFHGGDYEECRLLRKIVLELLVLFS
jgi:hypothetical protein